MLLDTDNKEFSLAFDLIANRYTNIFLTGRAGTGKTTFLKYVKENVGKNNVIVAPTGVAAVNAGGVTVHSFFQIKPGIHLPDSEIAYDLQPEKRAILQNLDLLIIDEISMIRSDLLDMVDKTCKHYRKSKLPFGGIQMLMIGDPYQLPPVVDRESQEVFYKFFESPFFFKAKSFSSLALQPIELKKIYRQKDVDFINLLNKVRINELSDTDLQLLNSKVIGHEFDFKTENYMYLATVNSKVEEVNIKELNSINAKEYVFKAHKSGKFENSAFPADELLRLKVGAQVMFIKNDSGNTRRFYNGKTGIIHELDENEIKVKFPEGSMIIVDKATWQKIEYKIDEVTKKIIENVVGTFTQYPLKLAWAITVHKSQGLSLDKVYASISSAWASGQVYVALSRCTTFDGLKLSEAIPRKAIKVNPEIEAFYKWVIAESNQYEIIPKVVAFTASKKTVNPRDSITLTWNAEDAEKVLISGLGEFASKGEIKVFPKSELTYSITAFNGVNQSEIHSISIQVNDTRPKIQTFKADKSLLIDESKVRLEWSIEDADRITIEPNIGEVTGKDNITVDIDRDTEFILHATSYFGITSSKKIRIEVSKDPPIINEFMPDREFVVKEFPITLTWNVKNAKELTITPFIGSRTNAIGSAQINVERTTTFILSAKSKFGIISQQETTIFVVPIPIIESLLVPELMLETKLDIRIDRPSSLFPENFAEPIFSVAKLNIQKLVSPKIEMPSHPSIWKLPDFSGLMEAAKNKVSQYFSRSKT